MARLLHRYDLRLNTGEPLQHGPFATHANPHWKRVDERPDNRLYISQLRRAAGERYAECDIVLSRVSTQHQRPGCLEECADREVMLAGATVQQVGICLIELGGGSTEAGAAMRHTAYVERNAGCGAALEAGELALPECLAPRQVLPVQPVDVIGEWHGRRQGGLSASRVSFVARQQLAQHD